MATKRARKARVKSEDLFDVLYRRLSEAFPEWRVKRIGDSTIVLSYESPYPEDNEEIIIDFLGDKVEMTFIKPTGEEEIDPLAASEAAYEECKREGRSEAECQRSAENAYRRAEKKIERLEASGEPYITREVATYGIEHAIYIPAKAHNVTVDLSQLRGMGAEEIADLIIQKIHAYY